MLLPSYESALSLVSLVDGYFRLTADSSHYLCHEVAPPRLVMSILNGIHGPMQYVPCPLPCPAASQGTSRGFGVCLEPLPFLPLVREEFVFAKLRREEQEEGLYIIRWSVLDFNRMILSVVKRGHQQVGRASRRLVAFPGEDLVLQRGNLRAGNLLFAAWVVSGLSQRSFHAGGRGEQL